MLLRAAAPTWRRTTRLFGQDVDGFIKRGVIGDILRAGIALAHVGREAQNVAAALERGRVIGFQQQAVGTAAGLARVIRQRRVVEHERSRCAARH